MANKYFIFAYNICKLLVDEMRLIVTTLFVEYDHKQITIVTISTNLMLYLHWLILFTNSIMKAIFSLFVNNYSQT